MPYEIVERDGMRIAVISGGAAQIRDASSALDLAMSIRYETGISRLAIDKEALCGDFFILSTGVAGEILQKFINYRFKAAIYGDYTGYTSKPLWTLSGSPTGAGTSSSSPRRRRPFKNCGTPGDGPAARAHSAVTRRRWHQRRRFRIP